MEGNLTASKQMGTIATTVYTLQALWRQSSSWRIRGVIKERPESVQLHAMGLVSEGPHSYGIYGDRSPACLPYEYQDSNPDHNPHRK